MRTRIASVLAAAALAVLIAGASPPARKPVARPEDRAVRAALAATRGGKAVKVGRELEGGAAWEVEVLLPRGRRVDVLLDARFRVLGVSDEREPGETRRRGGNPGAARAQSRGGGSPHLAARAASKAVGGGMLTDVDREPGKGAAWEVEFVKLDGKRVSVLLDDRYRVVRVARGKSAN